MQPTIYILRTPGYYVGQVRGIGCRYWRKQTGKCKTAESALAKAIGKMGRDDKRARALFCPTGDTGSYYGPTVSMEAKRR